ncbi:hypothetical protein EMIT0215P_40198 [Pseudomonas serboccidentalis]
MATDLAWLSRHGRLQWRDSGSRQNLNGPPQPRLRGIALCEESLNEPSVGRSGRPADPGTNRGKPVPWP